MWAFNFTGPMTVGQKWSRISQQSCLFDSPPVGGPAALIPPSAGRFISVLMPFKGAVVSERIGRVNIRADEKQNPVSPHLGLGRGVVEFPGDYEMQVCFDVVLDRP
ncbi:unnamed protein product [Leuciscus chuanchicus]